MHVARGNGAQKDIPVSLPVREGDKHKSTVRRSLCGAKSFFKRMGIAGPKVHISKDIFDFGFTDSMLSTFRPVPVVPLNPRDDHRISMHLCMYKHNLKSQ